jgi:hypothetical protein
MAYDSGNIFAKIIAGDIPCHKVCMRAPVACEHARLVCHGLLL